MRSAVIVAAGSSSRFGKDKLFEDYLGFPLLWYSVTAFEKIADEIIVVCSQENYQKCLSLFGENISLVLGGNRRQQSVLAGVKSAKGDIIAIHDGARPFVSRELIAKAFECAEKQGSCLPVIKCADTLYADGGQFKVIDRENVLLAQTPQVFDRQKLLDAFDKVEGRDFSDEAQVWQKVYGDLAAIDGEITNRKITFSGDLPKMNVGQGYDIHKLTHGKPLYLGGVRVAYEKGLLAHSDGDVALHALMDALLSSCALPDIGHYFPDSEQKYSNIDSKLLLKEVTRLLEQNNAHVLSLSLAIICQQPKLAPYIPQMKDVISKILNIPPSRVGISATTAEGMGEIGNCQAIAALCGCIVQRF